MNTNYDIARRILNDNREALDRLAEGLIVWETLDYEQVRDLVDGKDIGVPLRGKSKSTGPETNEGETVVDETKKEVGIDDKKVQPA